MPSFPIVGAHYRPPAPALLKGISEDTKLILRAEPTNQFDINAIQVILNISDIKETDYEFLNESLSGYGKNTNDIMTQEEWHLGYIPKEIAKVLRANGTVPVTRDVSGHFSTDFRGKPIVVLD